MSFNPNPNARKMIGSPFILGASEIRAIKMSIGSDLGTNPSSPVTKLINAAGETVTSDFLSGSDSVTTDTLIYTTKLITGANMTKGEHFRIELKWVNNTETLEAWGVVIGD